MFSGGMSGSMLWAGTKTKPPPGANVSMLRRTWSLTSLGRPPRQDLARVAAAAPERDVRAEVALEPLGLHVLRGDLDGVDDVDAGLDQVGQELVDRAARVQERLHLAVLVDVRA